jgi:type VI protein secretion system component VasA
MRPWAIVIAVIAGLALVFLVVYGSNGRDFSGRDRDALNERALQPLVALPVALGPAPAIAIVQQKPQLPSETTALLDEVRNLVSSAEGQPADQAKPALEQAIDKLDLAIDQVDDAANDESNDLVRLRLREIQLALEKVRDVLEDRLEHLS